MHCNRIKSYRSRRVERFTVSRWPMLVYGVSYECWWWWRWRWAQSPLQLQSQHAAARLQACWAHTDQTTHHHTTVTQPYTCSRGTNIFMRQIWCANNRVDLSYLHTSLLHWSVLDDQASCPDVVARSAQLTLQHCHSSIELEKVHPKVRNH